MGVAGLELSDTHEVFFGFCELFEVLVGVGAPEVGFGEHGVVGYVGGPFDYFGAVFDFFLAVLALFETGSHIAK